MTAATNIEVPDAVRADDAALFTACINSLDRAIRSGWPIQARLFAGALAGIVARGRARHREAIESN